MKRFISRMIVLVLLSSSGVFAPTVARAQDAAPPPPINAMQLNATLNWIARLTAQDRQSFCYRDSYGRGVGVVPTDCKANQEKGGALCYPKCDSGFDGVGPGCWQSCPSGFSDIGISCHKPGTYGRNAFANITDSDWDKCRKEADGRGCEKHGDLIYPRPKPGYHCGDIGLICTAQCPNGMRDDGLFCAKAFKGRGLGEPLVCAAGMRGEAGLCYHDCKNGFNNGGGPVCWQQCADNRVTCGVGCADKTWSCVSDTASMVIAPAALAMNVFNAAKGVSAAAGLLDSYPKIKTAFELAKLAGKGWTAGSAAKDQVDNWVRSFSVNFATMTSESIAKELETRLKGNPAALAYVKEQFALNHLNLMLQSDRIETGQNMLAIISIMDPSGISSVVSAYAHPMCLSAADATFPDVFKPVPIDWKRVVGLAAEVAIGGNGQSWALGLDAGPDRNRQVWRWEGSDWVKAPGAGVQISADDVGQAWVVNAANELWRYDNAQKKFVRHSADATAIAIGSGEYWKLGATKEGEGGYAIYKWFDTGWRKVPGGAVSIAVASPGEPWVVNAQGSIYRMTPNGWQPVPGKAQFIAAANGNVVALNKGDIYSWDGNSWTLRNGKAVRAVLRPDGVLMVTNAAGEIFTGTIVRR